MHKKKMKTLKRLRPKLDSLEKVAEGKNFEAFLSANRDRLRDLEKALVANKIIHTMRGTSASRNSLIRARSAYKTRSWEALHPDYVAFLFSQFASNQLNPNRLTGKTTFWTVEEIFSQSTKWYSEKHRIIETKAFGVPVTKSILKAMHVGAPLKFKFGNGDMVICWIGNMKVIHGQEVWQVICLKNLMYDIGYRAEVRIGFLSFTPSHEVVVFKDAPWKEGGPDFAHPKADETAKTLLMRIARKVFKTV